MRIIRTRFEQDASLTDIEVIVRAPGKDAETEALLRRIENREPETLTVTDADGAIRKIKADGIVSVSVMGKQVQIVTEKERFLTRQPLQSLEDALNAKKFMRISRHELVNLEKVIKYDFTLSGTLRLELTGGMETWASRRCIPAIRGRLNGKEG